MEYEQIILDLLNRVINLEKEVSQLKANSVVSPSNNAGEQHHYTPAQTQRDKTKYLFNGNVYLKNRLVLAVVTDYVKNHPEITREQLKTVFDKSLQGSMGVVENIEYAIQRNGYAVRFFVKQDERLHFADGDMLVCSQWGILNIVNFIKRAEQLGYHIEAIN